MAHPAAATWRKVGVREGDRVVVLRSPAGWDGGALPAGAVLSGRRSARADVVVAFYATLAKLRAESPTLAAWLADDAMLWVAWPRKAAGHVSDLSDNAVRETVLAHGLVDVKVAALDDEWSGLKFVRRRELRARRATTRGRV